MVRELGTLLKGVSLLVFYSLFRFFFVFIFILVPLFPHLQWLPDKLQSAALPGVQISDRVETDQPRRLHRRGHHPLELLQSQLANVNAEDALHDGQRIRAGEDLADQGPTGILTKNDH